MGDLILYFLFAPLAFLVIFNAVIVLVAVNGAMGVLERLKALSGAQLGLEITTGTLLWDSAARSITLFLLGFVPVVLLGGLASGLLEPVAFDTMAFPIAGLAGLLFGLIRSCMLVFAD